MYHVAGARWAPGADLESWNMLVERGVLTDANWRWDDAPVGHDGGVVSLHETLHEAREHMAIHGGSCIVAIDTDACADAGFCVIRNSEGYPAISQYIPARMLTVVS